MLIQPLKQLFQAVKSGNKAKARKLQKLLFKSHYAKLLAVRKVTQDNQGRKTAGIDGKKVLTPHQRQKLVKELESRGYKAKALRRIWIPKPGRDEKRPLGIPTIKDRAMQALVKIILEPYWEALFEDESYGFRPGRSTKDAIERIYCCLSKKTKYVLDADIAKCFDKINHDYLLSKLQCPSNIRALIKQWLKAGIMDKNTFKSTQHGTPQGGVISPLLANIALDGMIRDIKNLYPKSKRINGVREYRYQPRIIRYADDFVVIHSNLEVINECKEHITNWLKKAGLELKPEKTRICNTMDVTEIDGQSEKPGFDFLGFHIRSYPVGKHHSGKIVGKGITKLIGHKTLIKPSEKAIKAHRDKLKETIQKYKYAPQESLISKLNPIIRGWSNYYSSVCSSKTFTREDHLLWEKLRANIKTRTGKTNFQKLSKYFHYGKHGKWTYRTQDGLSLIQHRDTKIIRHSLIKPEASIYDGDWTYWSKRSNNYPNIPIRVLKLMKNQKGKCNYCGQHFLPEDVVEIDHIIPKHKGGKDVYNNLQLLHRHCHDTKTKTDMTNDCPHVNRG